MKKSDKVGVVIIVRKIKLLLNTVASERNRKVMDSKDKLDSVTIPNVVKFAFGGSAG